MEQRERIRQVEEGIEGHGRLGEDRYEYMERQRIHMQKVSD